MGDHRSESADSRAHRDDPGDGTIPVDKVVGRAFVIVWPPSRAGVLTVPETFRRRQPRTPSTVVQRRVDPAMPAARPATRCCRA
jgi:signal peptidase I